MSHYFGFGDVNGDGRPDIALAAKGGPQAEPGTGEWFAWWEAPVDPPLPPRHESPREHPAVNTDMLNRLRDLRVSGQPDPVAEIIDLFLQQTPDLLRSLKQAFGEKNLESVGTTAHMLKGSCANLGAEQMAEWSRELESMARQGRLSSAEKLPVQLEHEFAAVRQILEAERAR